MRKKSPRSNQRLNGRKPIRSIRINTGLDDYKAFFDTPWAQRMLPCARVKAELDEAFTDLCFSWRGLSNAFRFPTITARLVQNFADSYTNVDLGERSIFLNGLRSRLANDLVRRGHPDAAIIADESVGAAAVGLVQARDDIDTSKMAQELWDWMLSIEEFPFTIAALTNQTYAGLFFAYERFLSQCFDLVVDVKKVGMFTSDNDFPKELKKCFGASLAGELWTDDDIVLPKLIRHSLAHSGGRMTRRLEKFRQDLNLVNEAIQLNAFAVTELHSTLKSKVEKLTKEMAVKLM